MTLLAMAPMSTFTADTVLINGRIWTGDPANPEATAAAIWNGTIVRTGSNAEIQNLLGNKTETIDLKGRRVVPGFYDSHLHFLGGGIALAQVDLKDAKDEAEFGRRLMEFDKKLPKARWLLGGNWDHDRTFAGKLPTAALLDKYVKDRPIFIRRYDGHMAVANTMALQAAGITAATKDPPGGVIERGPDGTPTGGLKDNAMGLVARLVPEPDDEAILEAIRAALKACAAAGITSVQDMEGSSDTRRKYLRMLQRLDRAGELTLRIDVRWPIAQQAELARLGIQANFGGRVRIGGLKGFMDGSLGSSTAKMFAPYVSDDKTTGVFVTPPQVMDEYIEQAKQAGLSVAIHAIGDEANSRLLDLYEKAAAPQARFRIEHAQHLRPSDYPRFKQLGVIASMQPYHVIDDGRWAEGRIGPARCESSYAFRSLLDKGAVLAFGSDWPVAPLNVLEGIDAAVNRRTLDGKHPEGWFPQQRITVAEAVKAYTWGSAYGGSQEHERGSLAPGKVADLVVLDRDIFDESERDNIAKTKVLWTMVNGKVVFESK